MTAYSEMMEEYNIPDPHMMESVISEDLPGGSVTAFAELIDNAFGKAAGDADKVVITVTPRAVIVQDNGRGMADINALFRYGRGDSKDRDDDIGRFGVGSKKACGYFGKKVTVTTVRDGIKHQHSMDYEELARSGMWEPVYKAPGIVTEEPSGTTVEVARRHNDFKPDVTAAKLAHLYRFALRDGKSIRMTYQSTARAKIREYNLADYIALPAMEDWQEHEIDLGDRWAFVSFGLMEKPDSVLSGVHYVFANRVIATESFINGEMLPGRLYVSVQLSSAYKDKLTNVKTKLKVRDADLDKQILDRLRPLLDRLASEAKVAYIEKFNSIMADNLTDALKFMRREGEEFGPKPNEVREPDEDVNPPDEPNEHERGGKITRNSQVQEDKAGDRGGEEKDNSDDKPPFGIKIEKDDTGLADTLWQAHFDGQMLTVRLNGASEFIQSVYGRGTKDFPANPHAMWHVLMEALIDVLMTLDKAALKVLVHRSVLGLFNSDYTDEQLRNKLRVMLVSSPINLSSI